MDALPPGYQVVRWDDCDPDEFRRVFCQSVGREKGREYFLYSREGLPHGKTHCLVLQYEGAIIGAHTIRPLSLSVAGETVRAGLTMDAFVHPGHRGRGLFTALVQRTTRAAADSEARILLGFANGNSRPIYRERLGHFEPGMLEYLVIRGSVTRVGPGVEVHDHVYPDGADEVIANDMHRDLFRVVPCKDPGYVCWRYLSSPESRYTILFSESRYLAIFKDYGEELQLVDFFCVDPAYLGELLESSLALASGRERQLSCWLNASHPLAKQIEGLEYSRRPAPQFLHVWTEEAGLRETLTELANWHYVMGDSDVF